ncbi:MAG TPA: DUF72 domain-containing protein [Polyangiaceae bacterium]|nr:DUF72 domain-containing protein [Polyangiaceae bacterium]
MSPEGQATLFELSAPELAAAPASPEQHELASRLPRGVRLGTMSWSFAGWRGIVYGHDVPESALSARGLEAYGRHPLLGGVEIDRSYYEPLSVELLSSYARQVPDGFQFLVKAHEVCSVQRFPTHARYGSKRGALNPLYLDPIYAAEAVVQPVASALGPKLGAILFQFPPAREAPDPQAFAAELERFLSRLPRGIRYAIELRDARTFTPAYAAALVASGALHCHNAWSAMPDVLTQAKQVPPAARRPLIVRWLLARGERYDDMRARFHPFDRIAREDAPVRSAIARLVAKAAAREVPALVTINNKAEGCAPESAFRLARAIVDEGGG